MTVPTYRPKVWLEAWTRPGHATFKRVISDVPVGRASVTARANGVGDGTADLPHNYSRLDEIIKPDPTTPANAVSSLMRVFQEGVTDPIAEWLPAEISGAGDKADADVAVKGASILSILGHARVEAWDWEGIDDEHSLWPDWIWGGRNILGELASIYSPAITRIYTSATSGTFTIGVSFNGGAIEDTDPIAFNASETTVKTELEENTNVGTVNVQGSGTVADPWRIQTVTPEGTYVLSTNSAGLTGGLALQDRESIGVVLPNGWTTSFNPLNNLQHGLVTDFRTSDFTGSDPAAPVCDAVGLAIMFDGAIGPFGYPGIQKIVPVKPGGRYYANVTVWADGTANDYRLVIRDLYERCIAASPTCDTGTTVSADTWTTFSIPLIEIPLDVDRVIFRFASVDPGTNPPPTFIACIEMREGMPPTTWGDIWEQLYADATSDHELDPAARRIWRIGATGASYLTLDFDETNDSNGNAWADSEVKITLKRGQSYLRVASECFKQGYEGRIVPDDYETGTWLFQLYNPGTAGTVLNLGASPVIMGGRDIVSRDVRRFLPTFTDWAVEAGGQNISRERSATAITALGQIEGYTPNQDLGSLTEAGIAAATALAAGLQQSQSLTYTVAGVEGAYPLVNYNVFDTVNVDDPPDVPKVARRIKQIQLAWDKSGTQSTIQLGSESYVGVGAIYEGVNTLLKEFKAIRDRPDETTDPLNYFQGGDGGAPTIVIAAADSTQQSKDRADFICNGVDDQGTIRLALNSITKGRVILCEGNYNVVCVGGAPAITVPAGIALLGLGRERCGFLVDSYSGSGAAPILRFSANFYCRDIGFFNNVSSDVIAIQVTGGSGDIIGCGFDVDGKAMDFSGGEVNMLIADNVIAGTDLVQPLIDIEGGQRFQIRNNQFFSGLHALRVENASGEIIFVNNYVDESYEENLKFAPGAGAYCAEMVTIIGNQLLQAGTGGVFSAIKIDTTRGVTESGLSFHIIGNIIEFPISRGIELVSANQVRIVGNYIEEAGRHGISLNASSDCMIHDNYIWYPSQTTDITYDGIFLEGDSNDNSIQANQFIKKAATFRTRYCVNVSAAACDRTVVVSNQMRNGYVTAAINDAGTGTIILYPAGGAGIGDNFV